MIKINLISPASKKLAAGGDLEGASFETLSSGSEAKVAITAAIKIAIILVGSIALYYYENEIQIPEKQTSLQGYQQELTQIQTKNNSAAVVVEQTKKYEESETKLLQQIQTLESLRGDSLREVRVLDQVQKEMPERIWFTRIELKESDTLDFEGISSSEAEVNQLIDILGKNPLIKEVNLGSTKEKVMEGINLKEFKLSCVFKKYEINRGEKSKSPESPSSPTQPSVQSSGGAG